jgi:hypothetical protein
VDETPGSLDARVAAAADAWLADPQDVEVYRRLVTAVRERRAHLDGAVAGRSTPSPALPAAASDPEDEVDGEDDARIDHASVRALGASLSGDPREVLARLRGGGPS